MIFSPLSLNAPWKLKLVRFPQAVNQRREFLINAGLERHAAFEKVREEEAMAQMASSVVEVSA